MKKLPATLIAAASSLIDFILSDVVRTAMVRTESFAGFRNRIIPAGLVSVTGILIEQNGQYIILPLTSQSIR